MAKLNMTIEIELGCTGGEEDGVDNSDMDASELYTSPEDVAYAYEKLMAVSPRFTIAASFGNVHGVYQAGNVVLTPTILRDSQAYCAEKFGIAPNALNFVFHGGSGSSEAEIQESIGYGVIKMNIDTDTQWASWDGVSVLTLLRTVISYKVKSVTQLAKLLQTRSSTIHAYGYVLVSLQWLLVLRKHSLTLTL